MQFAPETVNDPLGRALLDERTSDASDTTMEMTKTSSKILEIIFEYALNKFDDSVEQRAAGRPKFLSVINQFVTARKQVEMCLPAFPFKSANKVDKVFGILPDKAEELALERLNTMCLRIGDVYSHGAKLTIISDGLVYNGLSKTDCSTSFTLSRLLIRPSRTNRLIGHPGSRYVGLRRGPTRNGCPEGVQPY